MSKILHMNRHICSSYINYSSTALKFSYSFNCSLDPAPRCRWSTHPDEPLLFVKYDWSLLNFLDAEKKALILEEPVEIEEYSKLNRL